MTEISLPPPTGPGAISTPLRRVAARASLLPLLGLMYASACGGPYGTEDFLAKVGPGLFMLLLFVTPWIWGMPTAFATAELSSRRPVAGGYYRWASEYLGPFWGYQDGVWNLLMSLLDNALYPVLFARAVSHLLGGVSPLAEWGLATAFIFMLAYLNLRGIQIAGTAAIALNVFLILPLIWLVVAGFSHVRFDPFVPFRIEGQAAGAQFGACLALAMWFYSGYYEVSAAAEEIENPRRNIPLALLILSPLVIASYALPTLAGLVAVGGWESWTSGEFATMGHTLGGPVLGTWLFLGGVASQAVIFLAYLLWWSRLVWVMAEDGHLPAFLRARHRRFDTPHRVLLLYAIAYSAMAALPFENLLVADLWITGASNLMLQGSLVSARYREGGNEGGFLVPGGKVGLWLNVALPTLTWSLMLYFTADEHYGLGVTVLLFGTVTWFVTRWFKRRSVPASAP